MQACRLSLAEVTHPAKVVKVWLDPSSQSLALMLSDSSCLLYSLKFTSIAVQIPAPVTDGCFLRLLQKKRLPHKKKSRRVGVAPCDRGAKKEDQGAEGAVFFLATMPDRGGCRTVLRAWSHDKGSSFRRSLVEVKDKNKGLKFSEGLGKKAAGVLDLPHGFAVKIAASVNVFVVHSAAAGKIWVMAAKVKEIGGESSNVSENSAKSEQFSAKLEGFSAKSENLKGKLEGFNGNSDKLAGISDRLEGLKGICGNLDGLKSSGEDRVCISLIKCSVVDCNGPVYSITVSLQHMILGEENGVRVWALRPLVKGRLKNRIVVGEKGKERVIVNKFGGGLDKGNLQVSCAESGPKFVGLNRGNSLESDLQDGRKIGALNQLNLQANFMEGNSQMTSVENEKLGALNQNNSQANSVECSLKLDSAENGRKLGALDQLNSQANSVEGNLQLNFVENGWKIRVLDRSNSLENSRKETCLAKRGEQVTEGEELFLGHFMKAGNVENEGGETIVSNRGEIFNKKEDQIGKACEKTNNRQASSYLDEKDLDVKLDDGKRAWLTLKKPPRNGAIEDAIGGCKDVPDIYCNGAKMGAVSAVSLHQRMLLSAVKGSVDAVVNSVNCIQCNCTNAISNGVTETGFKVGNLVNCTLHECEANSLASKRSNGQSCPNRDAALDDSYTQQQLSQQSSSSSASSSLSGSVASLSVSISASASSPCVIPSALGSTHSSEGTIHAPVSSLLLKNKPSLKMRDTSGRVCSFFVPFQDAGKEGSRTSRLRAIAIHALSQTKFVVLDSAGDLHFLSLHNLVSTGEGQKEQDPGIAGHCCLRHLRCSLKVKMLAAFPETSSSTSQKLWASDGRHSIHLLSFPNVNASPDESDKDLADENPLQLSVMQAVFLSDRIRAIAAMSANATLVLTQGSIITYAIAGS